MLIVFNINAFPVINDQKMIEFYDVLSKSYIVVII